MSSETIALIAILVAAASEIIALNPKLKSNSVVQLVLSGLQSAFPKKEMIPQSDKKSAEKPKEDKFEWHDEGVGTLVRIVILGWAGAILTLNYVSIPGLEQKQIDPTFIASVFTSTLVSFGVDAGKKKKEPLKDDPSPKA